MDLLDYIEVNPIIAAVRNMGDLRSALSSTVRAVFLLTGDINTVGEAVRLARQSHKGIYLHLDLLEGLGKDKAAVHFLAQKVRPDGVITTRSYLIQAAKAAGLYTIQRIFILDSLSVKTGVASVQSTQPDAVECLPGILPRVFGELVQELDRPIIAGGLLQYPEEMRAVFNSGVKAVSVSKKTFWNLFHTKEEFLRFCRIPC
ncbi:MAG: glycerol-3-phosphate responsive antiterminator [Firmicutes bacterium]|jgi:glycerol uptake operon antiterminator|nr:glycerol-3-phosphate responsive antiterminator [Bacillota bacterium]